MPTPDKTSFVQPAIINDAELLKLEDQNESDGETCQYSTLQKQKTKKILEQIAKEEQGIFRKQNDSTAEEDAQGIWALHKHRVEDRK